MIKKKYLSILILITIISSIFLIAQKIPEANASYYGYPTVGSYAEDTSTNDILLGYRFLTSVDTLNCSSISAYVYTPTGIGTAPVYTVIYADDLGSLTNTVIALSNYTLVGEGENYFHNFTIPITILQPNTYYWIYVWSPFRYIINYDTGVANQAVYAATATWEGLYTIIPPTPTYFNYKFSIFVNYNPITYYITASNDTYSNLTPNGLVGVGYQTNQIFTYSAVVGHIIQSVLVDGSPVSITGSYTFTNITASHSISVSTNTIVNYINATSDGGSAIYPSGIRGVNYGFDQTFSYSANSGYTISAVLVDGSATAATGSYSFSNVVQNHTIQIFSSQVVTPPNGLTVSGNTNTTTFVYPTPTPENLAVSPVAGFGVVIIILIIVFVIVIGLSRSKSTTDTFKDRLS